MKINNKEVKTYILENDLIRLKVANLGCIIQELVYKPLNRNVVLNKQFIEDYLINDSYIGVVVGPTAGRIENARYTINEEEYILEKNHLENNLHSGSESISFDIFDVLEDKNRLVFQLYKMHTYGTKNIKVDYQIVMELKNNSVDITYFVKPSENLFVNMTNHSYFNLSDNKTTILNHYLKINADSYYQINDNFIPSFNETSVKDTVFDFRDYKKIDKAISEGLKSSLKHTNGIDNPFKLNRNDQDKPDLLKDELLAVSLKSNDLILNVFTVSENVVIYTGNYLEKKYSYIAIETQNHPNIINSDKKDKYIYNVRRPYVSMVRYELKGV